MKYSLGFVSALASPDESSACAGYIPEGPIYNYAQKAAECYTLDFFPNECVLQVTGKETSQCADKVVVTETPNIDEEGLDCATLTDERIAEAFGMTMDFKTYMGVGLATDLCTRLTVNGVKCIAGSNADSFYDADSQGFCDLESCAEHKPTGGDDSNKAADCYNHREEAPGLMIECILTEGEPLCQPIPILNTNPDAIDGTCNELKDVEIATAFGLSDLLTEHDFIGKDLANDLCTALTVGGAPCVVGKADRLYAEDSTNLCSNP